MNLKEKKLKSKPQLSTLTAGKQRKRENIKTVREKGQIFFKIAQVRLTSDFW